MNNNDLLKRLHTDSENILPTYALDPETIEASLVGVKRKNNKKIISSVCLIILTICVSTMIFTNQNNNDISTQTKSISKEFKNKTNYSKIYEIIKKMPEIKESYNYTAGTADVMSSISENKSKNYSETNIQVKGVDEGDIVKINGEYIFSTDGSRKIYITATNYDSIAKIATIKCNFFISEMYLNDNKLLAVGEEINYTYSGVACGSHIGSGTTKINIFDLSDIKNPVKEADFTMSGNYISSRKIGDVVYLNTSYCVWNSTNIEKNKPETYCPTYICDGTTYCIESDNIVISNIDYEENCIDYTTVMSINLNKPNEIADTKAVLGTGDGIYSTAENYYVYSTDYSENKTEIFRFSLNNGKISAGGTYETIGSISDQFAIDEYNGYLRTVTQKYDKKTKNYLSIVSIFTLDTKLIGQLSIPTKKETLRSVRFDENIAYFVTFKTIDPLFAVDLSNPTEPRILSELKVTGFSEYLHKINDSLLFGFGANTNDKGNTIGLKLSLFDTTSKKNITEIDKLTFGDNSSWSEAEYNHKAIYFDEDNMIIGIPYESYNEDEYYNYEEIYSYGIFKVDTQNNRLNTIKHIICEKIQNGGYAINNMRGVRIGDNFYIVTTHKIYSYDYKTFEHINTIKLSKVDY